MAEFVPHGYISVRAALNCLGRELFPLDWTGEEYKARRGLISEDEWLKIKDLAPARGGGAPGNAPLRTTIAASAATAPHRTAFLTAQRHAADGGATPETPENASAER